MVPRGARDPTRLDSFTRGQEKTCPCPVVRCCSIDSCAAHPISPHSSLASGMVSRCIYNRDLRATTFLSGQTHPLMLFYPPVSLRSHCCHCHRHCHISAPCTMATDLLSATFDYRAQIIGRSSSWILSEAPPSQMEVHAEADDVQRTASSSRPGMTTSPWSPTGHPRAGGRRR